MKKIIAGLAAAGVLLLTACTGGIGMKTGTDRDGRSYQYTENDPFHVRIYTLENGLKVYLSANPAEPTVNLMTIVKAGSMDEPANSTGLAHYFEHMMFKGTDRIGALNWEKEKPILDKLEQLFEERRNASDPEKQKTIYQEIDKLSAEAAQYAAPGEFAKLADSIGASSFNAATSYNYTNYIVKIPSGELEKYLLLESERFRRPVLRLFHTELETVYEEFNRGQDNDYRRSLDASLRTLFPGHPVGRSVIGLPEHIKAPSMKDTMNFYRTFYVPSNMAIILSGDLQYEAVMQILEKTMGALPAQPAPEHKTYPVKPLEKSVVHTVQGSDAEHFRITYRIDLTPENRMLATMLSILLCDNGYGLFDQNLVRANKVLGAAAFSFELRDQIIFMIAGNALQGQTLEQAVDLVFQELSRVEQGKFEDWRIRAVAENMRVRLAGLKSGTDGELNDELADLFLSGMSYGDFLSIPDRAELVTKQQLSDFINSHLKHGVTVLKKTGKPENVVKVEKPAITPVVLKTGEHSPYAKEFLQLKSPEQTPEHLIESEVISRKELSSGRTFVRINKDYGDGLFNAQISSPRGKFHDKRIEMALGYLEFLGTEKYSAEELRQEFYKMGAKLITETSTPYQTVIEITGPQGRYQDAMALLDHFLREMKPDPKALQEYISRILKTRADTKQNPFQNFQYAAFRSWYGKDNPFVNILSEQEMRAIKPEELISLIREMFTETAAEVIYSGPDDLETAAKAAELLPAKRSQEIPARPFYPTRKPEKPTVWLVRYDKVQLTLGLLTSGTPFDPEEMAFEALLNEYFFSGLDSVVFQEIRESRALAYSANGHFFLQMEKGYCSRAYMLFETQPDKALEAVRAGKDLLKNFPFIPAKFQAAKQSVLKKLASERKFSFEAYELFRRVKRAGLKGDWRRDLSQAIKEMNESAFRKMAREKLSDSVYDLVVVGQPDEALRKALEEFGTVKELTPEEIFGY